MSKKTNFIIKEETSMNFIRCKNWDLKEGETLGFETMGWANVVKIRDTTYFFNSEGKLIFESKEGVTSEIQNDILAISDGTNNFYFRQDGQAAYDIEIMNYLNEKGLILQRVIGVRFEEETKFYGVVSKASLKDHKMYGLVDFSKKKLIIPYIFDDIQLLDFGLYKEIKEWFEKYFATADKHPYSRLRFWSVKQGSTNIIYSFDGRDYYEMGEQEKIYGVAYGCFIIETPEKRYYLFDKKCNKLNMEPFYKIEPTNSKDFIGFLVKEREKGVYSPSGEVVPCKYEDIYFVKEHGGCIKASYLQRPEERYHRYWYDKNGNIVYSTYGS